MPAKNYRDFFETFIRDSAITIERIFTKGDVHAWFKKNLPQAKHANVENQLLKKTTNYPNRVQWQPRTTDDMFYALDPNFTQFQLYQAGKHPAPHYKNSEQLKDDSSYVEEAASTSRQSIGEDNFAYEKDLQNYLAKHPDKIESGLRLYEADGVTGIEYSAGGGRRIDLLCIDKDKNLVVIELKVSRGHEQVSGQLLRYMGWIRSNLAEPDQKVRGIIVARNISEDLKLSISVVPNTELFEYEMSVKLKRIEL
jgi:hypothetical protein